MKISKILSLVGSLGIIGTAWFVCKKSKEETDKMCKDSRKAETESEELLKETDSLLEKL